MLALDSSLSGIEIAESEVLDLFESQPVSINLSGSRPEPRTAYVCAVKKAGKVRVYVALTPERGRSFIYTKSDSGDSEQNYRATLQQALEFARSMGFTPERVNLDYGPAMRAVVVKNFKVFNSPGKAKKVAGNAPSLAYQKPDATREESPAAVPPHGVSPLATTASVASAAVAATASVTSVISTAKTSIAPDRGDQRNEKNAVADVIVKFGTEMAALRAERESLSAKVQELSAAQLGVVAELKSVQAENRMLKAQRDELAQVVAALDTAPSELAAARNELARFAQEREEARQRSEELVAQKTALSEAAAGLEKKLARAQDAATGAEQAASRAKEEAASAKNEAMRSTEEATRAREEAAIAQKEAARAKEEASMAQEEAARAKEDAYRVQEEAARAKEDAYRVQEEATHAKEEAYRAQEEAAHAKEEAHRAQEEAARAGKDATRMQEKAARALEDAARAKEEATGALDAAGTAQEDVARALEEAATMAEAVAIARHDAATARQEAAKARDQADRAQKEAAKLAKEKESALRRAEEISQAKGRAGSEIEELVAKVESSCSERDAALSRVETLEQHVETLRDELEAARNEVTTLVAERERLSNVGTEETRRIESLLAKMSAAAVAPEVVVETSGSIAETARSFTETAGSIAETAGSIAETAGSIAETAGHISEAWPDTPPIADFSFSTGAESAAAAAGEVAQPVLKSENPVAKMTAPPVIDSFSFAGFDATDDFFGDFSAGDVGSPIFVKTDRTAIEYGSPADVLELLKSFNVAQVALDGKIPEVCEGYICCLRIDGQVRVFAALYGTRSGGVGVYAPESQPADEHGMAAAVAGAVCFHEQVGLMMEPVDLHSSAKRSKAITGCPVLKTTADAGVSACRRPGEQADLKVAV